MTYKLIYLARRAATVSRADWPRTWRSHAIFASQFPVLEAKIDWMRYCNRIDETMAGDVAIGLPELSTEHDGVSIASSPTLDALDGGGFTREERALIDKDELRVFDMLTPHFSFYCVEEPLLDGKVGEVGLFRFLARKPGISRADFEARWLGEHARIARAAVEADGTIGRYAHNRSLGDPLPLFPFDGISECWHATVEDAAAALEGAAMAPLIKDLPAFCDMERSVTVLTRVCHRWPKD
jgi:hypothetical protein